MGKGGRKRRFPPLPEVVFEILSESAPLPFPIEEHHATTISDEVRYQYRYLDQLPAEQQRAAIDRAGDVLSEEQQAAVCGDRHNCANFLSS